MLQMVLLEPAQLSFFLLLFVFYCIYALKKKKSGTSNQLDMSVRCSVNGSALLKVRPCRLYVIKSQCFL